LHERPKVYSRWRGAPGDPELLTLKAGHDCLLGADVVLHDALVSDGVLAMVFGGLPKIINVGKRAGGPQAAYKQDENQRALLVSYGRNAGQPLVRLKGGDPSIFLGGPERKIESAAQRGELIMKLFPGISRGAGSGGRRREFR